MEALWRIVIFWAFWSSVNSQGYLPIYKLRKATPLMDGHANDVYQTAESRAAVLPDGMALLYASAPIYSLTSKDPEAAQEMYAVLPENEALRRNVQDRRLLEDTLLELGFPLEEVTDIDPKTGRVLRVQGDPDSGIANPWESSDPVTENPSSEDIQADLASLLQPVPYRRRGAWGK